MRKKNNPTVCLDICIGERPPAKILVELFPDAAPKAAENLLEVCTGEKGTRDTTRKKLHYKGSTFHQLTPEIMAQGGDFSKRNGIAGESTNGEKSEGGSFKLLHDEPGLLSMANDDPRKDGSEFFITLKTVPHLNGKHVVFGKVVRGMEIVMLIQQAGTNDGEPTCLVKFVECDEVHEAIIPGKGPYGILTSGSERKRKTLKLGKYSYPNSNHEERKGRHRKSLKHGKKKRRRRYCPSDSSSSDSDSSSSDSSFSDGRYRRKKTLKRDKHTLGKRKWGERRKKKRRHHVRRGRPIIKWSSEISSDTESESSSTRAAEEVRCHGISTHKTYDKSLHLQNKSGKRRHRKSLKHRKKKHRRRYSSSYSDSDSLSSDLSCTDGRRRRKKTSKRDKHTVEKKKRGMPREKKQRRFDKRPRLTVKWSSEISSDTESNSTSNRSAEELVLHGGSAHKAYDKSLRDQHKALHDQDTDEQKKPKVKTTIENSSLEEGEIPEDKGELLNMDLHNAVTKPDKTANRYSGSDGVESKSRSKIPKVHPKYPIPRNPNGGLSLQSVCPTGKDNMPNGTKYSKSLQR